MPLLLVAATIFTFQNNFWVNLHQLLRGEARRQAAHVPVVLATNGFSDAERVAWSSALDVYAQFADKDPLFDAELVAVNNALTEVSGETLAAGVVPPAIARALAEAAPVYRTHAWDRHRQMNADWIARVQPLVDAHANALTAALAKAYHVTWPPAPIIVDISNEANRDGAYTTNGPPGTAGHTTMASSNAANSGDMSVEMIFHEASHTVDEAIMKAVDAECARQGLNVPRDLWHGIIFYTSGELVRRELRRTGDARYLPYAYRYGVWERGEWPTYRAALERDWQPWLDGKTSFEGALRDLIRDAR